MAWTYWNWAVCNILIGVGIFLFIYLIMGILLWRFHQVFYSMVAKLFNIKRCIIDVNHNIVKKNNDIYTIPDKAKRAAGVLSRIWRYFGELVCTNLDTPEDVTNRPIRDFLPDLGPPRRTSASDNERKMSPDEFKTSSSDSGQYSSNYDKPGKAENVVRDFVEKGSVIRCCWSTKVDVSDPKAVSPSSEEEAVSLNHPAHPDHQREVLNVYGKLLTLNKKRNKFLIITISVIVISSVSIAGFQGCFLANITVYENGPCPFYGVMECFTGRNSNYFQCTPGDTVNISSDSNGATCFRWIARDITVSDVMTQVGACTGLLTAFGSAVEVLLRLLLFVFQQRPSVASGIRRLMEKTVGINKITQPCRCCGSERPFHCGVLNLNLYQRPWLVIIFFGIYLLLPAIAVVSIVLMSSFRISITALTYILLVTIVAICCLALLWVLWEEDEVDRIMPGGFVSPQDISKTVMGGAKKFMPLLDSVIPEDDLKGIKDLTGGLVNKLNSHAETILMQLTSHTEMVIGLTRSIGDTLPIVKMQEIDQLSRKISSKNQAFKQLQGVAQEIRARKEAEHSKDLGSVASGGNHKKR